MNKYLILFFKLALINLLLALPFFLLGLKLYLLVFTGLLALNARSYFNLNNKLARKFSVKKIPRTSTYKLHKLFKQSFGESCHKKYSLNSFNSPLGQCFYFQLPFKPVEIFFHYKLMQKLSPEEHKTLATIISQEVKLDLPLKLTVAHIAMQPITLIASTFDFIFRFLSGVKLKEHRKRSRPVTFVFTPTVKLIVNLFAPSRLKFKCDIASAQKLKNNHKVSRLILKINNYQNKQDINLPVDFLHLFFAQPLTQFNFYNYLYWQPSIKSRTTNLIGHYPA